MNEEKQKGENSFRNILKGTSIFGGVQVFNIVISAVRLKFVAIILGPAGMGVAGLFNTASLTIQQFTSLGLNLSVVKEIGHHKDDPERLKTVLTAIKPLILISCLLGASVCLLFPGILSSFTFGSNSYHDSFMLLSVAVLFSVAGSAMMSVLQGLHEVKLLSKSSIIGSSVGLLIGVPMYWWWGTYGIVPALCVFAIATFGWYWYSLKKTLRARGWQYSDVRFQREVHLPVLKKVLLIGLVLMSNDLLRNLGNYLINVFIRIEGGESEVGFFQSCNTMTSQYAAIVFTAMAMDYLPRLASASGSNKRMCEVVNRQIEIVGLLIAPIVCLVILLAPVVIKILQTAEFLVAVPLLRLLAMAVVVKALMYPLGYIVFAKDNKRLFFWMESVGANIMTVVLTCGGYALFGLNGLGYAAIADCFICLCIYILINRHLYGYHISKAAAKIIWTALISALLMTSICFLLCGYVMIVAAVTVIAGVSAISLQGLRQRLKKEIY